MRMFPTLWRPRRESTYCCGSIDPRQSACSSLPDSSFLADCLRHRFMSAFLIYDPLMLMTRTMLAIYVIIVFPFLFLLLQFINLLKTIASRSSRARKSGGVVDMCFRADKIVHQINLCHFHRLSQLLLIKQYLKHSDMIHIMKVF